MNGSGFCGLGIGLWLFCVAGAAAATGTEPGSELAAETRLDLPDTNLWRQGVGEGFNRGAQSFGLSLGAGYGVAAFGGVEEHHLALASISYGYVLTSTLGEGHWYRGNLEFRGEFFGGAQFSPSDEWLVGLVPHLRYLLATGSPWMPFLDVGAGVAATGIGAPDLSGTFEFNLQAGVGTHYFLRNDLALTVEVRLFHLSCAGINQPNQGLNNVMGLVGLTKLF